MHLYRKVALGINQLDEQGKVVAIAAIDIFAHQVSAIAMHQLGERQPHIRALGYHRLPSGHGRQFPTLADGFIVSRQSLEGHQLIATPQDRFKDAIELINLHKTV